MERRKVRHIAPLIPPFYGHIPSQKVDRERTLAQVRGGHNDGLMNPALDSLGGFKVAYVSVGDANQLLIYSGFGE